MRTQIDILYDKRLMGVHLLTKQINKKEQKWVITPQ
jgi:hypothetical protein